MAIDPDDENIRLIDLNDYALWVLWQPSGECQVGSNGVFDSPGLIYNLRSLADELERQDIEERRRN